MKRSVAVIGLALLCAIGFFGLNALNQPKGIDTDKITDLTEYLSGVPADAVVATVNGHPVAAEEFLYWAGYTAESAEYYMGELDWTASQGDVTLLDYVKESALETCKLYSLVETKAEEMGCGFTEEDMAEYQAGYANMVAQLGGEEAARKWLMQVGLGEGGYLKINRPAFLYTNMLDSLLDVSPATAEEMADYIAENDVLKAKHILVMTIDPATRQPLSEEEQAAKKVLAEEIFALLQESDEPLALFDELMHEYSEDTGLVYYPEGYTFTAGEMVTEFEQGTRDLGYGEISDIIQSDYGYHIILRLDPADEALAADLGQLLGESEAQAELEAMVSDWMAEAEVETTEVYESLDVAAYYDALKLFRTELEAQNAAGAEG